MPTICKILGYNVYFMSNEGYPLEPVHVHVGTPPSEKSPKFWILRDGSIKIARNGFLKGKELNAVVKCLEAQQEKIVEKWMEHFSVDHVEFYGDCKTR